MHLSLKQHQEDKMSASGKLRRRPSLAYLFPPLPTETTASSKAIPIAADSIKCTASELQLMEDEAMADYRDHCMYTRIVNGMMERRSWWTKLHSCDDDETTRAIIRNITRNRHLPVNCLCPSCFATNMKRRNSTGVTEPLKPTTTAVCQEIGIQDRDDGVFIMDEDMMS